MQNYQTLDIVKPNKFLPYVHFRVDHIQSTGIHRALAPSLCVPHLVLHIGSSPERPNKQNRRQLFAAFRQTKKKIRYVPDVTKEGVAWFV